MNNHIAAHTQEDGAAIQLADQELRSLVNKIEASGLLGRSQMYRKLLDYLCECSIAGTPPKEITIAIDVMGKDSDFDVKNDSLVRVYMHKLRQKLEAYYQSQGSNDRYQLVIPKGSYALSVINKPGLTSPPPGNQDQAQEPAQMTAAPKKPQFVLWLLSALALLTALNLLVYSLGGNNLPPKLKTLDKLARNVIWAPLLEGDDPIMLVIGDYYLFGEHGTKGNPDRLIREYHINSPKDLADEIQLAKEQGEQVNYYDLKLSYLPRAAAFALNDLLPVLTAAGKTVDLRPSSEFRPSYLKTHHIIYVGYLSAMGDLQELPFTISHFSIGNTFDELIHLETGTRLKSEEVSYSVEEGSYFDYGMISTFPMPSGRQMLFVAGTRDTGLMHMAHLLSNKSGSETLIESMPHLQNPPVSFEAFYKVRGVEGVNIDAERVYSGPFNLSDTGQQGESPQQ